MIEASRGTTPSACLHDAIGELLRDHAIDPEAEEYVVVHIGGGTATNFAARDLRPSSRAHQPLIACFDPEAGGEGGAFVPFATYRPGTVAPRSGRAGDNVRRVLALLLDADLVALVAHRRGVGKHDKEAWEAIKGELHGLPDDGLAPLLDGLEQEVRDACSRIGVPIFARWCTGYGFQAIVALKPEDQTAPLARIVAVHAATIDALNAGAGYELFDATQDSGTRLGRLVGSYNRKNPERPRRVRMVERSIARVGLAELPQPEPLETVEADHAASPGGGRPGDDFDRRVPVEDLMYGDGWVLVREGRHDGHVVLYLCRPGKDPGEGHSATVNYRGTGRAFVFTSSTPLPSFRHYSPFQYYAFARHGGDFRAAARDLASRGYGDPDPRMVLGASGAPLPSDDDADALTSFHLTDLGNAQRLVRDHGADLRFCRIWGKWLVWDGRRWAVDDTDEVVRRAKATVLALYAEAAAEPDGERRKALTKHALRSEGGPRLDAMVALAASEPGVPVRPAALDRDPWLLAVANGTLDLRTGVLRPHDRADLITKLAPVAHDPGAACPAFLAFLDRIMAGDAGLVDFLRRACGYSLTGLTVERVLLILWGEGRNGKSTLLEVLRTVWGDYALRTPTETLLAKRDGGVPNDVARLKGARLVTAAETDEGRRLDEAKLKDLTGGDTISARFMRGEWFDFLPEFTLWLATNHKPVVRGRDRAVWDRLRLVPFAVRIPDDEQDPGLRGKLVAEAPGILAWAVAGCLEWGQEGLGLPGAVREATDGYRAEMDALGGFLADRCVLAPGAGVAAGDLYAAYRRWCEEAGEKPLAQKAVGQRLAERGLEATQVGKARTRTWRGIGLRPDPGAGGADASAGRTRANAGCGIAGGDPDPRGGSGGTRSDAFAGADAFAGVQTRPDPTDGGSGRGRPGDEGEDTLEDGRLSPDGTGRNGHSDPAGACCLCGAPLPPGGQYLCPGCAGGYPSGAVP